MNLLFVGDIFASAGRRMVAENLQRIISEEHIDLTIANAENAAGGFGITPMIAPEEAPGQGVYVARGRNGVQCAVINLQGRTYMPNTDCPFRKADQILESLDPEIKVSLVDFHAEVTSEKIAMGWHLNGRVSAVLGTHTHVPTADTKILDRGTAYQTDVGMTGPYESIIGVKKDAVLQRFLTSLPIRMEAAKRDPQLHAVIVGVDETTGKAVSVKRYTVV
jgi:metallophosphoesterase (TIGR00282 family)